MNEKIKSFQSTHIFAGNLSFYVLSEGFQFLPPVLFLNQITRNRKFHIPNFYLQRILWEYDVDNFTKQLHFVNIFYKRSTNSIFSAKETNVPRNCRVFPANFFSPPLFAEVLAIKKIPRKFAM